MKLRVRHVTTYRYASNVSLGHNEAKLRPRVTPHQEVLGATVRITPEPDLVQQTVDYFGNPTDVFDLHVPYRELDVALEATVNVLPRTLPDPSSTLAWEEARGQIEAGRYRAEGMPVQFVYDSAFVQRAEPLRAYAAVSFTPGRPILDAALDLMHRVHAEFEYRPGETHVGTPLTEVLASRRGVCQDFAHLMVACLRSMGLPARYVSGYLLTRPPPGQERLVGYDASHAWASLFCPSLGFVDLDPTNDRVPDESFVTVGWGRDFGDVSPIKGVILGGGDHSVHVSVDVAPT